MLIGIITAAMLGIQLYAKRGIQAGVKVAADQMSPCVGDPCVSDPTGESAQANGLSYETGNRTTRAFAVGLVLANKSAIRTHQEHTVTNAIGFEGAAQRTIEPGQDVVQTTGELQGYGPGVAQHSEVAVNRRR